MLANRPPVIVILGHVDHGKTSLLDYLRKSNLASREAGGITQSIRSFQLADTRQPLTFIDTPGHAAFSKMRLRGSSVADIAILIVASDDGVMPQTIESIQAIKAAKIPYLVALTKSDLNSSNPEKVKTQLVENDVPIEEFGGDIPVVSVSSKTGQGIPELLDLIHLISSLNPPQSDPAGPLEAFVLESHLDSHRGPVAAVIIKNGTLTPGAPLFQTQPIGKTKAIISPDGKKLDSALPAAPVEILGLTQVPEVGSLLTSVPQHPGQNTSHHHELPAITSKYSIILKTDVAGSQEAILASLPSGISVLSSSTGEVTESDVLTARNSATRIIGFNIKIPQHVQKLAEVEKVRIDNYKIIYELLQELDLWLHPINEEKVIAKAEILAEFKIGPDRIAGIKVLEGMFEKSTKLRLLRGEKTLGDTKFKTFKQGKTDIQSAKTGSEFGATFSPYLDFKAGDHIIGISSS